MKLIKTCFLDVITKHYVDFSGRTARAPFWWYVLFAFILCSVVHFILGTKIAWILELALLLPSLGIGARRLHDIGRSGWWLLIGIIPVINFIGAIVLIVFFVFPSKK